MTETRDIRLKRLKMRSWHRGTQEMDLILGAFADSHLRDLSERDLDIFERLLDEADQDLYRWMSGQTAPPEEFASIVGLISGTLDALLSA
ncbi:MAG: succinate dehydrogenase assembly factor 2 [Paracoccaceae bacterium]